MAMEALCFSTGTRFCEKYWSGVANVSKVDLRRVRTEVLRTYCRFELSVYTVAHVHYHTATSNYMYKTVDKSCQELFLVEKRRKDSRPTVKTTNNCDLRLYLYRYRARSRF